MIVIMIFFKIVLTVLGAWIFKLSCFIEKNCAPVPRKCLLRVREMYYVHSQCRVSYMYAHVPSIVPSPSMYNIVKSLPSYQVSFSLRARGHLLPDLSRWRHRGVLRERPSQRPKK